MPIIQIDWAEIKERFGDVTAFVALTHRQISLLLSVSEQLHWEKTFRDFGYDFADKDSLDWEIDDLKAQLMSPVNLTDIIQYIDEVEDLLRALQTLGVCCDEVKPISEKHDLINDDFPNSPPETWGGETVEDADDWRDLVCGAANSYVDLLKETNNELDRIITAAALGIGAIAGLLTLLSGAGLILAIGYGTAATIVGGLVAGASIGTFTGIDAGLESARDDIVCSILNGGPSFLAAEIEAAVGSLAWALWFQFVDYDSAYAVMIDGTNGNDNLPVNRGAGNCDCTDYAQYDYTWEFDDSEDYYEGWQPDSGIVIDGNPTYGNPQPEVRMAYNAPQALYITMYYLGAAVGLNLGAGDVVTLKRVEFDYQSHDNVLAPGITMKLYSDGSLYHTENYAQNRGSFVHVDYTLPTPLDSEAGDTVIDFKPYGGSGWYVYLDNVRLYFDVTLA